MATYTNHPIPKYKSPLLQKCRKTCTGVTQIGIFICSSNLGTFSTSECFFQILETTVKEMLIGSNKALKQQQHPVYFYRGWFFSLGCKN